VPSTDPATTGVATWELDVVSDRSGTRYLVMIGHGTDDAGNQTSVLEIVVDGARTYARDPSGATLSLDPDRAHALAADFRAVGLALLVNAPAAQGASDGNMKQNDTRLHVRNLDDALSATACVAGDVLLASVAAAATAFLGLVAAEVCSGGFTVVLAPAALPICIPLTAATALGAVDTVWMAEKTVQCVTGG
jgi:hypothetical protein